MLPNTTEQQAMKIAARAAAAVQALELEHASSTTKRVTSSAGVAMLPVNGNRAGSPAVIASDLIQMADLALYAAKKTGRDRILSAGAGPDDAATS